MAPEQANGQVETLDARTDIFALGGVLYNILTLHTPVTGKTVPEMIRQIRSGEILPPSSYNSKTGRKPAGTIKVGAKSFPQPPLIPLRHCPSERIPESLGAVAMKALALHPVDRYPSVPELQKDIEAYQGGFATGAEKASAWRQLALLVLRHKQEFTLAAVALGVLLATVAGFVVKVTQEKNRAMASEQRADSERQRAEIEKTRTQVERDRAEKTLVSLRETAPVFRDQAMAELHEQRLDAALKKLAYAIELRPDVAEYQYLSGNVLQTALRFAEAEAFYRQALARDPAHVLAKENLALCVKLRTANANDAELPSAALKEMRLAMLRQGRISEANILLPRLGKDIPLMVETCRTALGKNGIVNLLNADTIQVILTTTIENLSLLRGMRIDILIGWRCQVTDLSPLQGMALSEFYYGRTPVSDLRPLHGMPLNVLVISDTKVTDLSPLAGMPLKRLDIGGLKVSDLTPLAGMPLTNLGAAFTEIRDLTQLHGLPLQELNLCSARLVTDLRPLAGMPLTYLHILGATGVTDLKPLQGMPLRYFNCTQTQVTDLRPLHGMPLEELHLTGTPASDLSPLRGMPLRTLGVPNKSTDLTPLAECRQLEVVIIPSECPGINFLRSLPNLKQIGPNSAALLPVAEYWKQSDEQKASAATQKHTPP